MVPRRQEYGLNRAAGARSGSVVNFRTAGNSGSVRRSSAVLPSVLTFLVIVASGGLLLMIEKGMLNSMETPPPRGSGRRMDLSGQAGRPSRGAVDVESQVKTGSVRFMVNGCGLFSLSTHYVVTKYGDLFQKIGDNPSYKRVTGAGMKQGIM